MTTIRWHRTHTPSLKSSGSPRRCPSTATSSFSASTSPVFQISLYKLMEAMRTTEDLESPGHRGQSRTPTAGGTSSRASRAMLAPRVPAADRQHPHAGPDLRFPSSTSQYDHHFDHLVPAGVLAPHRRRLRRPRLHPADAVHQSRQLADPVAGSPGRPVRHARGPAHRDAHRRRSSRRSSRPGLDPTDYGTEARRRGLPPTTPPWRA